MEVMGIEWDTLHIDARLEICYRSCVNESIAERRWSEIEPWLRGLLDDGLRLASRQRVGLET